VLALTATAPEQTLASIVDDLGLADPAIVNRGVYRPNLQLEVVRTVNESQKRDRLQRLLGDIDGTGIVYASTVRQVDVLHDLFTALGFKVGKYHGRMSARQRHEAQDQFMNGAIHALIATNAFGMGIDKPDIRFVVHYNMPGSLEAYCQEAGRAGRDGESARCILFYQLEDRRTQLYFLAGRYPSATDVRHVYQTLQRLGAADAPVSTTAVTAGAEGLATNKVRVVLSLLRELGVTKASRAGIRLLDATMSSGRLDAAAEAYRARKDADRQKVETMMRYGQSAGCRWAFVLDHFGEQPEWRQCGVCDNCRNPPHETIAPPDIHADGVLR
jgi:ATP-dependent DNA helicase RecQ